MSWITYLGLAPASPARPVRPLAREAFNRLLELLLEQGRFALRQLQQPGVRESSELRALLQAGYLRLDDEDRPQLTPQALRVAEDTLLVELFQGRGLAGIGRHGQAGPAAGPEAGDEPQAYQPGQPLEHVDAVATLGQALRRGRPVELREEDVIVRPGDTAGRCCSVLLLDLSGSMTQHGKFSAARRLALALRALVRRRFPGDELITAGFASEAVLLPGSALLEVTPRDVGLYDSRQAELRVRIGTSEVPQHFTNIQAGLQLARRVLRGKSQSLRQILLVTDGDPTAHVEGDELVLCYPPSERTLRCTLEEARRCANEGIGVSVFGLVGEFSPPQLKIFVHRLARAGRGTAVCCSPRQLADAVVLRFVQNHSGFPR